MTRTEYKITHPELALVQAEPMDAIRVADPWGGDRRSDGLFVDNAHIRSATAYFTQEANHDECNSELVWNSKLSSVQVRIINKTVKNNERFVLYSQSYLSRSSGCECFLSHNVNMVEAVVKPVSKVKLQYYQKKLSDEVDRGMRQVEQCKCFCSKCRATNQTAASCDDNSEITDSVSGVSSDVDMRRPRNRPFRNASDDEEESMSESDQMSDEGSA